MQKTKRICNLCGLRILPDDNSIIIISRKRNRKVEKAWMWKAYKSKIISQFHTECFEE